MPPTKTALLCLTVALAGLGVAVHATVRVTRGERDLVQLAAASRAEGQSFVDTLRGEHAERQRLALDQRRGLALSLAAARRDRLLGLLAAVAAGLVMSGRAVLARIAAEVEEDRRHVDETTSRGFKRPE
jgi:hypothetical protein